MAKKKNIITGLNTSQRLTLENERSLLRPIKETDLKALLYIAEEQPNLLQYSPSPFGNKKALKDYILKALEQKELGTRYPFIIYDKKTQGWAGATSFGNISNNNQRVEIGWTWLGKKHQKTGLNRNNKFLMLSYAFEEAGFERVELKTDSRNAQSIAAMEKIGAKLEGTLRSHTLMTDGHRRDTVYYSILKEEWPKIKETIFESYKEIKFKVTDPPVPEPEPVPEEN